MRTATT